MSDLDDRVRQRAYEIWQEEGCPDGREQEHWLRAREEVLKSAGSAAAAADVPMQVPQDLVDAEKAESARSTRGRKRSAGADAASDAPAPNAPARTAGAKPKAAKSAEAGEGMAEGQVKAKRSRKA